MREKVTDAYSVDPDAALTWIKEIDNARSVEQLSSNKLPELEIQLAKAVKKCIKKNNNFHARISQLIEQGQQTGVRLTSRQIIYLMYEYLRPDTRGEDMYDLQDLFAIKLGAHEKKCSVDELANFLLRWDTCLTGINRSVDPDTLYTLFINQIEDIELLAWEMKAFEKLPEREKSYEKLYAICDDMITLHRKKKNSKSLHGKGVHTPIRVSAAAPNAEIVDSAAAPSGRGRRDSPGNRGRYRSKSPDGSRRRSLNNEPESHSEDRDKGHGRSSSRKKPCIDFMYGKCTRGAGCKYDHSKDGKRSHSPRDRGPPSRDKGGRVSRSPSGRFKPKCFLFEKGDCKFGANCRYSHATGASAPSTPEKGNSSNKTANSPAPTPFR
jgi:hypothetical protein